MHPRAPGKDIANIDNGEDIGLAIGCDRYCTKPSFGGRGSLRVGQPFIEAFIVDRIPSAEMGFQIAAARRPSFLHDVFIPDGKSGNAGKN